MNLLDITIVLLSPVAVLCSALLLERFEVAILRAARQSHQVDPEPQSRE